MAKFYRILHVEKDINIDSNQCDAHLQKNLRQDFFP